MLKRYFPTNRGPQGDSEWWIRCFKSFDILIPGEVQAVSLRVAECRGQMEQIYRRDSLKRQGYRCSTATMLLFYMSEADVTTSGFQRVPQMKVVQKVQ